MKYLLAIIRIILLFVVICSFYVFYRFMLIFIQHNDQHGFHLRHDFFFFVNNILGIRAHINFKPHDKAALYVSNHRGLVDWFILRYLDAFVVAKAEFRKIPVLGVLAEFSGIIYVKRESGISRGNTRKTIIDSLLNGRSILIYPEGTTNVGKTTGRFHIGTFEEAAKHDIPVVPIALEYKTDQDLWRKNIGTWSMFVRQFGKWRTYVRVRFGDPFRSEDPDELMQKVQGWIDGQLIDMQHNWSEVFQDAHPQID